MSRFMRKFLLSLLTLPIILFVIAVFGWFYSVQRLTAEKALLEISFQLIEPQHYMATLESYDGCHWGKYEIFGDQWRVDAQFIKWKTAAILAGFDARYRLERLSGRYLKLNDANSQPHMAHDISHQPALDLVTLSSALGRFNVLLDAEYGSSTYQDIDTHLKYRVYRTQSGLITRSESRTLTRFEDGSLTIRINHACEQQSQWRLFVDKVDNVLKAIFKNPG